MIVCLSVKPVGEPDAGNPPVRFDEREVETEHGMRLLRHRRGNPDPEYVEAYPTAPPLDSTLFHDFSTSREVGGTVYCGVIMRGACDGRGCSTEGLYLHAGVGL